MYACIVISKGISTACTAYLMKQIWLVDDAPILYIQTTILRRLQGRVSASRTF